MSDEDIKRKQLEPFEKGFTRHIEHRKNTSNKWRYHVKYCYGDTNITTKNQLEKFLEKHPKLCLTKENFTFHGVRLRGNSAEPCETYRETIVTVKEESNSPKVVKASLVKASPETTPVPSPAKNLIEKKIKSPSAVTVEKKIKSPSAVTVEKKIKSPSAVTVEKKIKSPSAVTVEKKIKSPTAVTVEKKIKSPSAVTVEKKIKSPTAVTVEKKIKSPSAVTVEKKTKSPSDVTVEKKLKSPAVPVKKKLKSPTAANSKKKEKLPSPVKHFTEIRDNSSFVDSGIGGESEEKSNDSNCNDHHKVETVTSDKRGLKIKGQIHRSKSLTKAKKKIEDKFVLKRASKSIEAKGKFKSIEFIESESDSYSDSEMIEERFSDQPPLVLKLVRNPENIKFDNTEHSVDGDEIPICDSNNLSSIHNTPEGPKVLTRIGPDIPSGGMLVSDELETRYTSPKDINFEELSSPESIVESHYVPKLDHTSQCSIDISQRYIKVVSLGPTNNEKLPIPHSIKYVRSLLTYIKRHKGLNLQPYVPIVNYENLLQSDNDLDKYHGSKKGLDNDYVANEVLSGLFEHRQESQDITSNVVAMVTIHTDAQEEPQNQVDKRCSDTNIPVQSEIVSNSSDRKLVIDECDTVVNTTKNDQSREQLHSDLNEENFEPDYVFEEDDMKSVTSESDMSYRSSSNCGDDEHESTVMDVSNINSQRYLQQSLNEDRNVEGEVEVDKNFLMQRFLESESSGQLEGQGSSFKVTDDFTASGESDDRARQDDKFEDINILPSIETCVSKNEVKKQTNKFSNKEDEVIKEKNNDNTEDVVNVRYFLNMVKETVSGSPDSTAGTDNEGKSLSKKGNHLSNPYSNPLAPPQKEIQRACETPNEEEKTPRKRSWRKDPSQSPSVASPGRLRRKLSRAGNTDEEEKCEQNETSLPIAAHDTVSKVNPGKRKKKIMVSKSDIDKNGKLIMTGALGECKKIKIKVRKAGAAKRNSLQENSACTSNKKYNISETPPKEKPLENIKRTSTADLPVALECSKNVNTDVDDSNNKVITGSVDRTGKDELLEVRSTKLPVGKHVENVSITVPVGPSSIASTTKKRSLPPHIRKIIEEVKAKEKAKANSLKSYESTDKSQSQPVENSGSQEENKSCVATEDNLKNQHVSESKPKNIKKKKPVPKAEIHTKEMTPGDLKKQRISQGKPKHVRHKKKESVPQVEIPTTEITTADQFKKQQVSQDKPKNVLQKKNEPTPKADNSTSEIKNSDELKKQLVRKIMQKHFMAKEKEPTSKAENSTSEIKTGDQLKNQLISESKQKQQMQKKNEPESEAENSTLVEIISCDQLKKPHVRETPKKIVMEKKNEPEAENSISEIISGDQLHKQHICETPQTIVTEMFNKPTSKAENNSEVKTVDNGKNDSVLFNEPSVIITQGKTEPVLKDLNTVAVGKIEISMSPSADSVKVPGKPRKMKVKGRERGNASYKSSRRVSNERQASIKRTSIASSVSGNSSIHSPEKEHDDHIKLQARSLLDISNEEDAMEHKCVKKSKGMLYCNEDVDPAERKPDAPVQGKIVRGKNLFYIEEEEPIIKPVNLMEETDFEHVKSFDFSNLKSLRITMSSSSRPREVIKSSNKTVEKDLGITKSVNPSEINIDDGSLNIVEEIMEQTDIKIVLKPEKKNIVAKMTIDPKLFRKVTSTVLAVDKNLNDEKVSDTVKSTCELDVEKRNSPKIAIVHSCNSVDKINLLDSGYTSDHVPSENNLVSRISISKSSEIERSPKVAVVHSCNASVSMGQYNIEQSNLERHNASPTVEQIVPLLPGEVNPNQEIYSSNGGSAVKNKSIMLSPYPSPQVQVTSAKEAPKVANSKDLSHRPAISVQEANTEVKTNKRTVTVQALEKETRTIGSSGKINDISIEPPKVQRIVNTAKVKPQVSESIAANTVMKKTRLVSASFLKKGSVLNTDTSPSPSATPIRTVKMKGHDGQYRQYKIRRLKKASDRSTTGSMKTDDAGQNTLHADKGASTVTDNLKDKKEQERHEHPGDEVASIAERSAEKRNAGDVKENLKGHKEHEQSKQHEVEVSSIVESSIKKSNKGDNLKQNVEERQSFEQTKVISARRSDDKIMERKMRDARKRRSTDSVEASLNQNEMRDARKRRSTDAVEAPLNKNVKREQETLNAFPVKRDQETLKERRDKDPEHDYKKEFKSDANGLYCLKLDRIPFKDEEQVYTMFTKYGQVADVHFSDNNVFVRYKSKTVAAIALRALIMDYNICAHNRDIEKYLKKERLRPAKNFNTLLNRSSERYDRNKNLSTEKPGNASTTREIEKSWSEELDRHFYQKYSLFLPKHVSLGLQFEDVQKLFSMYENKVHVIEELRGFKIQFVSKKNALNALKRLSEQYRIYVYLTASERKSQLLPSKAQTLQPSFNIQSQVLIKPELKKNLEETLTEIINEENFKRLGSMFVEMFFFVHLPFEQNYKLQFKSAFFKQLTSDVSDNFDIFITSIENTLEGKKIREVSFLKEQLAALSRHIIYQTLEQCMLMHACKIMHKLQELKVDDCMRIKETLTNYQKNCCTVVTFTECGRLNDAFALLAQPAVKYLHVPDYLQEKYQPKARRGQALILSSLLNKLMEKVLQFAEPGDMRNAMTLLIIMAQYYETGSDYWNKIDLNKHYNCLTQCAIDREESDILLALYQRQFDPTTNKAIHMTPMNTRRIVMYLKDRQHLPEVFESALKIYQHGALSDLYPTPTSATLSGGQIIVWSCLSEWEITLLINNYLRRMCLTFEKIAEQGNVVTAESCQIDILIVKKNMSLFQVEYSTHVQAVNNRIRNVLSGLTPEITDVAQETQGNILKIRSASLVKCLNYVWSNDLKKDTLPPWNRHEGNSFDRKSYFPYPAKSLNLSMQSFAHRLSSTEVDHKSSQSFSSPIISPPQNVSFQSDSGSMYSDIPNFHTDGESSFTYGKKSEVQGDQHQPAIIRHSPKGAYEGHVQPQLIVKQGHMPPHLRVNQDGHMPPQLRVNQDSHIPPQLRVNQDDLMQPQLRLNQEGHMQPQLKQESEMYNEELYNPVGIYPVQPHGGQGNRNRQEIDGYQADGKTPFRRPDSVQEYDYSQRNADRNRHNTQGRGYRRDEPMKHSQYNTSPRTHINSPNFPAPTATLSSQRQIEDLNIAYHSLYETTVNTALHDQMPKQPSFHPPGFNRFPGPSGRR